MSENISGVAYQRKQATILQTADDLSWAQDVHGVPAVAQFCILYGNEDAPAAIECYKSADPSVDEEPFKTITFE